MPRSRKPSVASLTPSGMPYGTRPANEQVAQAAVAAPAGSPASAASPAGPAVLDAAANAPFESVGLADPTQRPGEPLMAGLDMGAGAGSEVLMHPANQLSAANDEVGQMLRDIYMEFPYPGIREMIEDHENG